MYKVITLGYLLEPPDDGSVLGYLVGSMYGMILVNPPGDLSISSDGISPGELLRDWDGSLLSILLDTFLGAPILLRFILDENMWTSTLSNTYPKIPI